MVTGRVMVRVRVKVEVVVGDLVRVVVGVKEQGSGSG